MLENFRGLKIKGRCFENETTLEFFPKNNAKTKNHRVALVFGRNGSGKTTISRSIAALLLPHKHIVADMTIDQIPESVNIEEITPNIVVFDEDYIRDALALIPHKKGIGTIILFGEQTMFAEKIRDLSCHKNLLIERIRRVSGQPSFNGLNCSATKSLRRIMRRMLSKYLDKTGWEARITETTPRKSPRVLFPDLGRLEILTTSCDQEDHKRYKELYAKKFSKLRLMEAQKITSQSTESELDIELLRNDLYELNLILTKFELNEQFPHFSQEATTILKKGAEISEILSEGEKISQEINRLKECSRRVTIAADKINAALAYIFMSRDRIKIKPRNDFYRIESNGHEVGPRDISIGERNALALAYFFSKIMEGKSVNETQDIERLIVLDDPVSSFDHENKMGVLSYIMHEMENLKSSRFICFMHDLHSFMALASSIKAHDGKSGAADPIGQFTYTLNAKRGGLKPLNLESTNEYRFNFDEVLEYAALGEPEENVHVGNQMRRILEAYSTFVYRKGFEYLFYGELIRGENVKLYNNYFKNIFSRFVVNDESHLQGRIRSLTNCNSLLAFIDNHERQRAIRDSICLLYLINPEHVLSLRDKEEEKSTLKALIEPWLAAIRENAPSVSEGVTNEA